MTIPASRVGDVLAEKYFLEELLGSGAMGDVYRARNSLVGRTVAIKVLKQKHAQDDDIVRRFLREARAANIVRHPNVVDVLDIGQDDSGVPFIVQECLEGEDLAAHLARRRGPMPLSLAFEILIPVVDAVAAAHRSGVVHRDLKPANVYLADVHGVIVPKLLDFGISKFDGGVHDVHHTHTNFAVGTPAYMSPEQVRGQAVDARVDVWALGVILYEVLAGRLPYGAEESRDLMIQIATETPVPIEKIVVDLPAAVTSIIGRCLSRDREARYATATELAIELRRAAGVSSTPPSRPNGWSPPASERREKVDARAALTLAGDETFGDEVLTEVPDLPVDMAPSSRRVLSPRPQPTTPSGVLQLADTAPPSMARVRTTLDPQSGFAHISVTPRTRAPVQVEAAPADEGGGLGVLYTAIAVVAFVGVASAVNGFVLGWHFPRAIVASHLFATVALSGAAVAAVVVAYRAFARRDPRHLGIVFALLAALAITGVVQLQRDVERDAPAQV